MTSCLSSLVLASLLQYGRHPATPNAPHWVSFLVPDDFIAAAEEALAADLAAHHQSPPRARQRRRHSPLVSKRPPMKNQSPDETRSPPQMLGIHLSTTRHGTRQCRESTTDLLAFAHSPSRVATQLRRNWSSFPWFRRSPTLAIISHLFIDINTPMRYNTHSPAKSGWQDHHQCLGIPPKDWTLPLKETP